MQRTARMVQCSSAVEHVRQQLSSKALSAQDILQGYLHNIDNYEAALGSFITVDKDGAMAQVSLACHLHRSHSGGLLVLTRFHS